MSLKRVAIAGAALLLATPLVTLADGDVAAGKTAGYTCLGCHGVKNYKNVYPTYHVPKICGQSAQYLLDALNGYADGSRPHETMHAQAATLSEADKQNIAAYFGDVAACGGK